MAKYNVTLIPGDGVGQEITEAAKLVIQATGVKIEWEEVVAGSTAFQKYGELLPKSVLDSIRRNKVALKGPITTPIGTGFRSVNVSLRKELDLYASVRPTQTWQGLDGRFRDVDIVVFRENTEDLYAGVEYVQGSNEAKKIIEMSAGKIRENSAISIKPISAFCTERIVDAAFKYAKLNGRKLVTATTKANIMKCTDGLFYETARKVAFKYPEIDYNEKLIDNMCMQLVQYPEEYDVIVLPNLYGDIISDLCAGIVGGLGMAPGANIGEIGAVFEPVHGSAPDIQGQDKVNPVAMILSAALMLDYLGENTAGDKVRKAVAEVIKEGKSITADIGGIAGTQEMASVIAAKL
ncbi:MAG: isocitrate/isopropylmalate dehydrogenase family protein [bacterium]|nr:isocitrate/isopropylmalate dehydrogenase family protein [bacterium]